MIAEKVPALRSEPLVSGASDFIQDYLEKNLSEQYYFHNFIHIKQVREAAVQLAEAAKLRPTDKLVLELSALFHSTGLVKEAEKYWIKSQKIAAAYLADKGVKQATIDQVGKIIAALEPGREPLDFLEKLFLDAHNSYLGQPKLRRKMKLLKKEKEALDETHIEETAWENELVARLKAHVFYTTEAAELFGEQKQGNLKKSKKNLKGARKVQEAEIKATSISANSGARTLFKVALRNHIDLTNIADQKANIMLSINALIITIGLPAFATYLTGTSYLILPASIFLLTSVATMIIATISTRPIKMDGSTDLNKLMTGKTNLFFFGNFYRIPQQDYQEAIKKIVAERDYLDSSFVNDLYFLGLALGDKFRYLRLCYNVFVIGVSISVIAFVIAFVRASILQ